MGVTETDLTADHVRWDLDPLLPAAGDEGLNQLLDRADAVAAELSEFRGKIADLDAGALADFMTKLAETRTTNAKLLFLARKIDQSQMPEIDMMQQWLYDHKQYVPDTSSYHDMMMPGMLTKKQIDDLQKARGVEFDRQFLQLMIQHHEGALNMVDDLFASYGALQDDDVYKFASDIYADQSTEIERMQKMLDYMKS